MQTKTPPKLVCPGGTVPTITFDPARVPRRDELAHDAFQDSNAGGNDAFVTKLGEAVTTPPPVTPPPVRPLRLSVSPRSTQAGRRACLAFSATSTGHPVAAATVHLADHTARTSQAATATICLTLRRGTHHASATKHGYSTAHATGPCDGGCWFSTEQ